MTMRFMDSFDHYGSNDLLGLGVAQKWTSGFGSSFVANSILISQGNGRYQNCLRYSLASGQQSVIFKVIDNQATWVIGFAFKISVTPSGSFPIVSLYDAGTIQCDLRVNSDFTLSVTRNSTGLTNSLNATTKSTGTLSTNTWFYIEWLITINPSISANTCKVNVNGTNTNWLNISTSQNTRNTANSTANTIYLGPSNTLVAAQLSGAANIDYDDLYICDGQGSTNNTFLGDTRIECRLPIANGTNTNFLTNLVNAYSSVSDSVPDGDAGYIYSSVTNDISTFTIPSTNATPSSIFAMQMIHCTRKSDAGNRQLADLLRSGSTNFPGTTQNLSSSYQYFPIIYENDPNTSAAWTSSAANNVEIGVKEIT